MSSKVRSLAQKTKEASIWTLYEQDGQRVLVHNQRPGLKLRDNSDINAMPGRILCNMPILRPCSLACSKYSRVKGSIPPQVRNNEMLPGELTVSSTFQSKQLCKRLKTM